MSLWKEGMYCIKQNKNSFDANFTDSKLNSHSISSRDIMKYSYNLGILSSEIEKVSDHNISGFRCSKENYKKCEISKNVWGKEETFMEEVNSSSISDNFKSKPKNLNSFAMTSLLPKRSVSAPAVAKLQDVPSTVRKSKQDVEKTAIPTIYENFYNASSNIKQSFSINSENETKGDTGIDNDTSTKITLFPPAGDCTTLNSDSVMKEKKKHFELPLSPTAKFRRAARRLGVLIPAQELYNKKRRNGVCEAMDIDADQRKLLRILNKKF